jgi:hypothetical protein
MEGSEGWERIPDFFAAAGDIQAKPTRVSGGLDLLVITGQTIVGPSDYILRLVCLFFYSGAVRGLLIGRSQQAIYRIVRNGCGYKTTSSDFHYVISGLNGEPKSASFFAF